MDIIKVILEFGTEAVLRYRAISQQEDNEVPEVFLGGFIACRLYDRFHCRVHVEYPYLSLASNLGIQISADLRKRLGGLRADLAMYEGGLPPAIIEFKIFDEGCQPSSVVDDLLKTRKLDEICKVRAYLGVMVCETGTASLKERVKRLEKVLDRTVHTSKPQRSANGEWGWCFGSSSVSETLRDHERREINRAGRERFLAVKSRRHHFHGLACPGGKEHVNTE